jgi:pyruvate dehydrogenase E1 component alpha subunit
MSNDFKHLPKETLVDLYARMLKIRKFEEKTAELFAQGLIPGLVHLYIGEEAVAVGVCANLRKEDYVVSTHRGHGHLIAKGGDLKRMFAELLGKKTGYSKGRGGSMHMVIPELGVMGSSGIVGAGIPIATGLGLAIDVKQTDQVVACFFGDGASNTGTFHEGINMAAAWKLPLIFVCENNLYAISVPFKKVTPIENVADRAVAYGIPGIIVDGMNVIAVYKAVQEAVSRAREGKGPTLIECKTYRFRGHYEGDPKKGATYRTEDEMSAWEKKCPIANFKTKLIEKGVLTENEAEDIIQKCIKEIEDAVKFAMESPYPSPDEILENLFV